jgi:hypothetical protein
MIWVEKDVKLLPLLLLVVASSAMAQRASVSKKELMGTYVKHVPDSWRGSIVRVTPRGKNRLWVDFNFVRVLSPGDANLGSVGGFATIKGDSATFTQVMDHSWNNTQSTCTIGMKFLKPGVLIISTGDRIWDSCLFGYRVEGAGRYIKKSGKRP